MNGHIGHGTADLREQDDIFVLLGGSVAYILRGVCDEYCFVGEVYLQGSMGGEAITEWQEGGLVDTWVTLR